MARGPRLKLLPMYVEPDLYRRLDEAARAADREATQQALHYIRQGLARKRPSEDGEREAEAVR